MNNKEVYLIFGPPGSGKTLQSLYLSKQLDLDYLSWGVISRDPKYKELYLKELKIIQDEKTSIRKRSNLIMKILKKEISLLGNKKSLILDGFIRRVIEADLLFEILNEFGYKIKALININPSLEKAYSRFSERLFCEECHRYYGELFDPKNVGLCDYDNTHLVRMNIDKNKLKIEFTQYLLESVPVIEYLRKYSELCFDVSGDDDEIVIFANILLKIRNHIKDNYKIFKRQTSSHIETKFGKFEMITYQSQIDYSYHLALVKGEVADKEDVLMRVHSSCITGDIFGSMKCDCGDQLSNSLKMINREGGVFLYLFQEGRGINIINKIQAYKLQREGMDTIEANEKLGFPAEMREYKAVKDITNDLKIRSIVLLTNNPDKVNKITELGISVQEIRSIEIKPNEHNHRYLKTKRDKMDHRLKKI